MTIFSSSLSAEHRRSLSDLLIPAFGPNIENCCAIFSISLSARFLKIALLRECHGQSSHPHFFPWVKDRVVPQAGLRQSRGLRAEGERLLWIFQAQREAQARFVEEFRSMTLGTGRLMLFTGDQNVEQLTDDFSGTG